MYINMLWDSTLLSILTLGFLVRYIDWHDIQCQYVCVLTFLLLLSRKSALPCRSTFTSYQHKCPCEINYLSWYISYFVVSVCVGCCKLNMQFFLQILVNHCDLNSCQTTIKCMICTQKIVPHFQVSFLLTHNMSTHNWASLCCSIDLHNRQH